MKILSHPLLSSFLRLLLLTLILAFSSNGALHAAPESITKQQAVSIAQQVYPGRVLSVKREAAVYRVKTLSEDGEVRIIVIDASSGKVISGS
jgi:uncharacterized membrane protein YkoI